MLNMSNKVKKFESHSLKSHCKKHWNVLKIRIKVLRPKYFVVVVCATKAAQQTKKKQMFLIFLL